MRWPVVALVGYVLAGVHLALRPALAIGPASSADIAPSFLIPLVVYVALSAPMVSSLWVALALGAIVDITSARGDGTLVVLGPYALGYMAAAYVVLTMRGLMIRRSILSVMFLSVLGCAAAELVVVGFFTLRALMGDIGWSAGHELLHRLFSSLYSGLSGGVVGLVLLPMTPIFGFQDVHSRRFTRRSA